MSWKIAIAIVLFLLLVSYTAYSQDLNQQLIETAKQGDTAAVKGLLTQGANVDVKGKNDDTALMWVAWEGHSETVKALLAHEADVNAEHKISQTALMYARKKGHTEIVHLIDRIIYNRVY